MTGRSVGSEYKETENAMLIMIKPEHRRTDLSPSLQKAVDGHPW